MIKETQHNILTFIAKLFFMWFSATKQGSVEVLFKKQEGWLEDGNGSTSLSSKSVKGIDS